MASVPITVTSIRTMVDTFYARVRDDVVLSSVFESRLAGKWDLHMPRMYAFWTKVLLGTGDFEGNVYGKHMALSGIEKEHFIRWLTLFRLTAIDVFGIEEAAAPITVAERIAASLQLGYFGEVVVATGMQRQAATRG